MYCLIYFYASLIGTLFTTRTDLYVGLFESLQSTGRNLVELLYQLSFLFQRDSGHLNQPSSEPIFEVCLPLSINSIFPIYESFGKMSIMALVPISIGLPTTSREDADVSISGSPLHAAPFRKLMHVS